MNLTVWVLLGELLFISLAGLIFLVIARWRKRKRLIAELAALLARVNRSEPDRQLRFQAGVMDNFGLDEDEAESLSIEIMRAERTLFKTFTEIQFGADIRKIGAFDKSVYALLDKYWELLAIGSVRTNPDAEQLESPDFDADVADFSEEMDRETISEHFEETASKEEIEQTNPADDFSDPTWDDAFAEVEHGHASGEMVDEILDDSGAKAIRSD